MELIKAKAKEESTKQAEIEIAKELAKSNKAIESADAHFATTLEDAALHHSMVTQQLLADATEKRRQQQEAAEKAFKLMKEKIEEEKKRK